MKPVIIIAIAFVLLIPNIAFAQEPRSQYEESEQEIPDFIMMSGLMIGMAGNFVMLYAFLLLALKASKTKRGLMWMPWTQLNFILGEFRTDKKIRKVIIIAIGLYVAGFSIQAVINSIWG